jgi:hypothetical protein
MSVPPSLHLISKVETMHAESPFSCFHVKMMSGGFSMCHHLISYEIYDESEDAIVAELIRTEGDVRAATALKDTGTI